MPEVSPPCMTGDVLCAGGSRTGAADDGRRECQREHSGAAVGRRDSPPCDPNDHTSPSAVSEYH